MKYRISVLYKIILITLIIINFISFPDHGICKEGIYGRYINSTFLEQLPGKIPGTIPVYCLEINFTDNDSAEIFNGFEEFKLAYRKDIDNHIFIKAVQGNDLSFSFDDSGVILLSDSAWTGIPKKSEFRKAGEDEYSSRHKWVFEKFLNEKMIAGNYILNDKSKSSGEKVILASDGKVSGLRNYSTYSICFSGDCTEETKPVSNTITFTDSSNSLTTYSFTYDTEKNSVIFRSISEPDPGIKGEREIKDVVYELMKN